MADWYKAPPGRHVVDYDPKVGEWIRHEAPDGTGPDPVPFRPSPPDWEAEERERLRQICDIDPHERHRPPPKSTAPLNGTASSNHPTGKKNNGCGSNRNTTSRSNGYGSKASSNAATNRAARTQFSGPPIGTAPPRTKFPPWSGASSPDRRLSVTMGGDEPESLRTALSGAAGGAAACSAVVCALWWGGVDR